MLFEGNFESQATNYKKVFVIHVELRKNLCPEKKTLTTQKKKKKITTQ